MAEPNGINSWSEALGPHAGDAALPSIEWNGKKYYFTVNIPAQIAHMERGCIDWARKEMEEILKALPDMNRPGTLDHELATEEKRKFMLGIREGWHRNPGMTKGTKSETAGQWYFRYITTLEGQLNMMQAALSFKQPGITTDDCLQLLAEKPIEMAVIMVELGNRFRTQEQKFDKAQETLTAPTTSPTDTPAA